MKLDQQTFARAATTALIGLGAQLILTAIVGLVGLYAQAPGLIAATWHLLAGLPLWFVLWMLFNQHRLERLEALEAEQLAEADAQAAALFQEAGEQLAMARQRLDRLYKFGLKAVGLAVALYLTIHGSLLFYFNLQALRLEKYSELGIQDNASWGILGLVLFGGALIAFLVARYIAGMTQFEAWAALRGGASYLMGNVLALALACAALAMHAVGYPWGFHYLAVVVPGLMVLIGLEIMLAFILSLYRPMRKGEYPRPIFDSRLLGVLTQPQSIGRIVTDTINYQFGFEISKSWFYHLMARATLPLTVICLLLVVAMSSVVIVAPQQQGIVTTFGVMAEEPIGPGLHFKAPWPLGRVEKYDVKRLQMIVVGSRPGATTPITGKAVLWTNPHTTGEAQEQFMVTASESGAGDEGSELIGGDVVIMFRITNVVDYVTAASDPRRALEVICDRVVSHSFRTQTVDRLLLRERLVFGEEIRQAVQADVTRWGLGVEVISVSVMALHPPQESEVAAAFHEQIGALQQKQSEIDNARRDAVSILAGVAGSRSKAEAVIDAIDRYNAQPDEAEKLALAMEIDELLRDAGGQAAQRLLSARARRWEQSVSQQARGERFLAEYLAYQKSPMYYRTSTYLDTMANALATRRKVILDADDAPPEIRIELKETRTGIEGIFDTTN